MPKTLSVMPLGGLGEIGRNMLVLEYDEQILIVDAGLMFPESDLLGVDRVIPDMSYVFERANRVRGIVITHGHEDHIGALCHLLEHVNAPVYATRLTRGLIEVKLRENRLGLAEIHTITTKDVLLLGSFRVEFFSVCHSIPDGVGLGITTPAGLVVHSGDYKIDESPVVGQHTDLDRLQELGKRGVALLLADSTNADQNGSSRSESELDEPLAEAFASAKGRIIVATFASNISRVQQVVNTAKQFSRKVSIVGRSMVGNSRIARELGYLSISEELMINPMDIGQYPQNQVTIICTGSQGERDSALVRMGEGRHRFLTIKENDTVIVSARAIPGNEERVNKTIDNLYRLGAHVFYSGLRDVHVSGHASREDQIRLINLVRPRFFVPIHGEYRHLALHAELAMQCEHAPEKAFILEPGDVLELSPEGAVLGDSIDAPPVLVDGRRIGDITSAMLEDRHKLSRSGFVVCSVTLDRYTNGLLKDPEIVSRGFIDEQKSGDVLDKACIEAAHAVELGGSRSSICERIETHVGRFLNRETGRHPIVKAIVVKI